MPYSKQRAKPATRIAKRAKDEDFSPSREEKTRPHTRQQGRKTTKKAWLDPGEESLCSEEGERSCRYYQPEKVEKSAVDKKDRSFQTDWKEKSLLLMEREPARAETGERYLKNGRESSSEEGDRYGLAEERERPSHVRGKSLKCEKTCQGKVGGEKPGRGESAFKYVTMEKPGPSGKAVRGGKSKKTTKYPRAEGFLNLERASKACQCEMKERRRSPGGERYFVTNSYTEPCYSEDEPEGVHYDIGRKPVKVCRFTSKTFLLSLFIISLTTIFILLVMYLKFTNLGRKKIVQKVPSTTEEVRALGKLLKKIRQLLPF
ncbi:uncharacterized protein LOC141502518 [Macrotis lagotis]|uniref:uncharacterized protein LOC141502518 n=1 Tax=Macrotis lagotis TaxID=92651 RepID=UPI003D691070